MPGHFLLRDKVDPSVFVDPFGGGRLLDARSCAKLFRQIQGPAARLDPAYLEPVERSMIIARVLGNLRTIYAQRGDVASLMWVLELRTLLPGAGAAEHTELAEILVATGDVRGGATAHERAAELLDASGGDGSAARETAARLRARLN
jgi:regulator of sirC expression with transglutaminase-like and TPR domain